MEILATAGVVGFSALCEGMRDAKWVSEGYTDHRVKRSLGRLFQKDLVVKIKTSAGPKWQLTPEGKKLFDKNNLKDIKITKPDLWDGKWRIVFFDVPEDLRSVRHVLRRKLIDLGFTLLQKSTFCCPYPCREEIMQITEMLGVKDHLRFVEGEFLSDDGFLRQKYSLN